MNPAVRAVAKAGLSRGVRVFGISGGYQGIFDDDLIELTPRNLSGILDQGGTFLQTSRCQEFYTPEGRAAAARKLRDQHIDGLIVIGGDGSLRGAVEMVRLGIPVIGLPGTIDNDIFGTDTGIGVDTAMNTISEMIDKIKDTARSHRRCFLVEVMGRSSGYLALSTAITSGAEVAVIPERRYNMPRILELLAARFRNRNDNSLIILAEGVCSADTFIEHMQREQGTNVLRQEVRKTVLGHVQRGGRPSAADRLMASRMGEYATMALLDGESGWMVGFRKGHLELIDLEKVCSEKKTLADDLLRLARNLGIEIGDAVEV